MNTLKSKLGNKKGFTLVEMLIVVAIIAILIAISIPLIGSALERARVATDSANERSAKAEALIMYLSVSDLDTDEQAVYTALTGTGAFYDAAAGQLVATSGDLKDNDYGQCTTTSGHQGGYLTVVLSDNGDVKLTWVKGSYTGTFSDEPHIGNPS